MTGKYRGPAHSKFIINVKQSQSNFISVILQNYDNYDCRLFYKKLVVKKENFLNFKIIPKTNEENVSITSGVFKFLDSYKF